MSHPFSHSLLFKWLRLITIVLLLPLSLTYFHLCNFLRNQRGVAQRFRQFSPNKSGIYFPSNNVPLQLFIPSNDLFAPSIVQLVSRLEQEPPGLVVTSTPLEDDKYSRPIQTVDYSGPSLSFTSPQSQMQKKASHNEDGINTTNQFGFRTNKNKRNNQSVVTDPPLATYFWIALNVYLFVVYKIQNVDPSSVALSGQVSHDYGRAITGNLAHFEIWHVGLNMMSAWTLGPTLETNLAREYGTIPLFLYTASLLAVNTLVVLGLHRLQTTYCHGQSSSSLISIPFPTMVGFSGILFAWSVVATLQTQQETCPIPILPNLCFSTYQIAGGRLSVSLGPLVQLVFLQVVLPRASFLGHLAGIVVGFLWHWNALPPLEYLQPCILYPIVWGIGKWRCCYGQNRASRCGGVERDDDGESASFTSWPSSTSGSATLAWSSFQSSALYNLLRYTRNFLFLHLVMMVSVIHSGSISTNRRYGWMPLNSIVLSQVLLLAILAFMIQHTGDKRIVGIIGRGLIVMVLVVGITDAMTVGGWLATRALWRENPYWDLFLVIWSTRFLLWALLLCLTSQTLTLANELVGDPGRGSTNDIWSRLLEWSVVDACRPVGKALADQGSNFMWQGPGRPLCVSSRNASVLLSSASSPSSVSCFEVSAIGEAQKRSREPRSALDSITSEEASSRVVSDLV
jgi:membrane associated rhomboid family serine protease